MKRENKTAFSITAIVMAIVLMFSTQMQIAAPALSMGGVYSSDNGTLDGDILQKTNGEVVVSKEEMKTEDEFLSDYSLTDNYGKAESMEQNVIATAYSERDILSDGSEELPVVEPPYSDLGDGVSVVPISVNNIIRDNIVSIISTKVYTFSLTERGMLIYAFNHVDSEEKGCSWHITLYEEYSPDGTGATLAYRELNQAEYTTVGEGIQSSVIGVLPGNYRLVVDCSSGFTDDKYDIAVTYSSSDSFEIECNDSMSRYTYLPLDKTFCGSASSFSDSEKIDEDWYMFEVTDKGYSVLYFEHETDTSSTGQNIAWKIRIVDGNGKEYYSDDSAMNAQSLNSGIMGLAKGVYFICVSSRIYSANPYLITISFVADDAIETEFNDTFESAAEIAANTEIIGALTKRDLLSDRDYYVFTLENDGFVSVGFTHEALSETHDGWNVTILNENGKTVYHEISNWDTGVLQTPDIGLAAGKYFILIDSDGLYHNSVVYRLVLLKTESDSWETEPNNTPETADEITLGKAVSGTMVEIGSDYDKDYFKFNSDESMTLKIAFGHMVTNEPDKEGWVVSLIDIDGNVLASEKSNWNEFEKTFEIFVEAGEYYILVESGLHFNNDAYLLNVGKAD